MASVILLEMKNIIWGCQSGSPKSLDGGREKMSRKVILISLLSMLCVSILGCSTTENEEKTSSFDSSQTAWESEALDDNLIADFQADDTLTGVAASFEAERTNVPIEQMQEQFFYHDVSAKQITQQYLVPEDTSFGYIYNMTSENGLQIFTSCEGGKGKTEEAEAYKHFLGYISEAWDDSGNPDKLGTDEVLSFLDKDLIETEIKNGLSIFLPEMDITKVSFYTLTGAYLNEVQNNAMEEIKKYNDQSWYEKEKGYCKEWNEEDGAYYITVEMSLDNIPIKNALNYELSDGKHLRGYSATFIYNRNGCVFAELPELLKFNQSQESSVISVAQALEALKKDITSVILTNENVIEDAKLQYVLVYVNSSTKLEIQPMWIFEGKVSIETNKGDFGEMDFYEYYFVNAITGEVLR